MKSNLLHPISWCFYILIFLCLPVWITTSHAQEMSRRRYSFAGTSNVCRSPADCPDNAYCERNYRTTDNGQCVCNKDFIIVAENGRRECYPVAKRLGDDCTYDEQCMITLSTESECVNNRCQCQGGTHYVKKENSCYKSVRIGDFCRFTNNCVGDGTVCRFGICRCPVAKHPNFDMTDCINDVKLGDPCQIDDECVTEYSKCYDSCRCQVSHVASKNATACLKVADQIYDQCEEDYQCTERIPYSRCDQESGTCNCKDGYHELSYKCWVSVALGGICEVDENCASSNNAICLNDRCTCPSGTYQVNNICSSGFSPNIFNQRILVLILSLYLFICNLC